MVPSKNHLHQLVNHHSATLLRALRLGSYPPNPTTRTPVPTSSDHNANSTFPVPLQLWWHRHRCSAHNCNQKWRYDLPDKKIGLLEAACLILKGSQRWCVFITLYCFGCSCKNKCGYTGSVCAFHTTCTKQVANIVKSVSKVLFRLFFCYTHIYTWTPNPITWPLALRAG